MRYLTVSEVLELHRRVVAESGGMLGILNLGGLDSAIAQPRMTFGGKELYPTPAEKASALGFSLITNHPFADGNKRTGHAAMEVFLVLNGLEIRASADEQEQVILRVAAAQMTREEFTDWLREHISEASQS